MEKDFGFIIIDEALPMMTKELWDAAVAWEPKEFTMKPYEGDIQAEERGA